MGNKSLSIRILAAICLVAFFATPTLAATKKATKKRAAPKPQTSIASQSAASIPVGMDYAGLVEKVLPSIVQIRTDKGTGSGFFASNKGNILTNYHVIEGAREIVITPHKGKAFYALVKDVDRDKDIALLVASESRQTPFLKISSTLPRQGEAIMAVGNPQGFEGTVSNGIISAFRENNTWVQFTAPISPGSSGGALINSRGEVVGMPTLLHREGQNLNFAIAPGVLRSFIEGTNRTVMPQRTTVKKNSPDKVKVHVERFEHCFADADGCQYFFDTQTVSYNQSEKVAKFWIKVELTPLKYKRLREAAITYNQFFPEGTFYLLQQWNINFDRDTYTSGFDNYYSSNGMFLGSSILVDYEKPIAPQTVSEGLQNKIKWFINHYPELVATN